jgi:hypothetical protein
MNALQYIVEPEKLVLVTASVYRINGRPDRPIVYVKISVR